MIPGLYVAAPSEVLPPMCEVERSRRPSGSRSTCASQKSKNNWEFGGAGMSSSDGPNDEVRRSGMAESRTPDFGARSTSASNLALRARTPRVWSAHLPEAKRIDRIQVRHERGLAVDGQR